MAEIKNDYKPISNTKGSKSYLVFAIIIAILILAIKGYLLFRIWDIFLDTDLSVYVNVVIENDFYRSIVGFIDRYVAWTGMFLLSVEAICQFYLRIQVFNDSFPPSIKRNFLQFNFFLFPLVHGFFPELFFALNQIDIKTDENFFIDIYYAKTYGEVVIIFFILLCLFCVVFSICCGAVNVSYENRIAPDIESASIYCVSGMSCGLILVYCVTLLFPFMVGMSAYVYNLAYMKEPLLQIMYISDFCLNSLFIYFYAMFYL